MGFTYLDKFTYLNTFVIQVAQRCSDNGGSTVLYVGIIKVWGFLPKNPTYKPAKHLLCEVTICSRHKMALVRDVKIDEALLVLYLAYYVMK